MALRWGIVSTGRIAHDFVCAVQIHSVKDHTVLAVAARSQSSADSFAKDHGIPRSYEGYDKLATDPELDIIYIGNLDPQHYKVSKIMIEHGKSVICEKPLTLNEKQTSSLIKLAREKKVFLMEAIWSRCFPAYKEMKNVVDSGAIGDVKFISVNLGLELTHKERFKSKEMGGGAILDLGVYVLQFQQLFFKGLKPIKIACNGHLNSEGTDDISATIITYPGGKTAVVTATAAVQMPNEGLIIGTKGTIKVPDFWCPTKLIIGDQVKEFPLPKSDAKFHYLNSAGLAYEAEEVRKCIKAGKIECQYITHEESLQLSQLMDTIRKQIGVVFREDNA